MTMVSCSLFDKSEEKWDSPFKLLWSSENFERKGSTQVSSPLTLGDTLVFMSLGGDVALLDQLSGEIKWITHIDSNTNIQSNVFKSDGHLIFATHTEEVMAFDVETGEIVWTHEFIEERGGFASNEIAYIDGKLFASGRSKTHCLDATTGQLIWSIDFYGNARDVSIYGDDIITSSDHKVYNSLGVDTSAAGWIHSVNGATGDSLWSLSVNYGVGTIKMAPVIDDDILYIGTSWRKPFGVQAFDLMTHEELWHYQLPNSEFICDNGIIADDVLVLSLAWYMIGGWNKNTGENLWVKELTHNYNWSRIGFDGRYIYYAHGWQLHVIDPDNGEILHSTFGPNGEHINMITVTDKRIFINGSPRNMCWTTYGS